MTVLSQSVNKLVVAFVRMAMPQHDQETRVEYAVVRAWDDRVLAIWNTLYREGSGVELRRMAEKLYASEVRSNVDKSTVYLAATSGKGQWDWVVLRAWDDVDERERKNLVGKPLARLGIRLPKPQPRAAAAAAVIVGDVFYSQWGYDQTNLDYYQAVKVTPAGVALRKIDKRLVRGKGQPIEYYMPIANKFVGPELRRKLKEYGGSPYVSIGTYASAYKWDGKEQEQTGGSYGH